MWNYFTVPTTYVSQYPLLLTGTAVHTYSNRIHASTSVLVPSGIHEPTTYISQYTLRVLLTYVESMHRARLFWG